MSISSNGTNKIVVVLLSLLTLCSCKGQTVTVSDSAAMLQDTVDAGATPLFAQALIDAYPECIVGYESDSMIFADGSRMVYNDSVERSWEEMLDGCDIEDMSLWVYTDSVRAFCDPGRIRCDALFKKMYGCSSGEVRSHTRRVRWCPTVVGKQYPVTTINHVADELERVSSELDCHPEWGDYLRCSGTFNWRIVAGTGRLSPHSFGIAIDIGVSKSNYWRWDNVGAREGDSISYHNAMLKEIVEIFERHGFIWGGYWYHYDTMHFEYRPELLRYRELLTEAKEGGAKVGFSEGE